MADNTEQGQEDEKEEAGGNKKLILFIVIAVLLIGVSIGVTLFLMMGGEEEGGTTEQPTEPVKQPAAYQSLDPPFVIDFNVSGRQRFLQVNLTVMGRDLEALEGLKKHMPLIRNNLVLLIGGFEYHSLQTEEGKEKLRESLTKSIQAVLEKEIGKPGIEQVLFTNFVMQ
ncbi:flagellar basal body-associated FliL family protein [Endozoicomonas sp. SM1973]|uniref:Flagellar protein FliL n=1 Tax=Spartinivicinus marinus TaxID=2994442 RepID=A0A853I451_9GAMM|nr:flagellar basal body-associated FliL family protein [Spartinivicinus marinus]MCX4028919.1 flagellar basal body-associated FliL family protein [Spartinivicinus marinus]NYZ65498.1 flagellar basal body-associated FliL family protein [Spartinivicinus marinus]